MSALAGGLSSWRRLPTEGELDVAYLRHDPTTFVSEMLDGFVAANADRIRRVPGGVTRASRPPRGQVAVVIGGGSGHYPAFAGLVGQGLAHGAVMGEIFASPSSERICSVARAADAGAGVLLTYGNYAGDVLNFDMAQSMLLSEGVDCRSLAVTDDVSSAPPEVRARRRGVAGDLLVFKTAAFAAEAGLSLEAVHELAAHANDHTRTLGVAFSGATLPGAESPLFALAPDRMGVGMGIHGEAGIYETPVPSTPEVAALLCDSLLAEQPVATQKLAVIVNGLGSLKCEELYVLYGHVARHLTRRGYEVVAPEVGEFCTSFEMAGVSLSLMWLDAELEAAWLAAADSPGYRRSATRTAPPAEPDAALASEDAEATAADRDSVVAGRVVATALDAIAVRMNELGEYLGELDAVAGDGDHGLGMQRGAMAASEAGRTSVAREQGVETLLRGAGAAWADRAGGTSGLLWGAILRALGEAMGDLGTPSTMAVATGVRNAEREIVRIGNASVGDKTMLDVLAPFAEALELEARSGKTISRAWTASVPAALEAAKRTSQLEPRMGRARTHGRKSIGSPDAGATSMAAIIATVSQVLESAST